jgi:hypothetical protein
MFDTFYLRSQLLRELKVASRAGNRRLWEHSRVFSCLIFLRRALSLFLFHLHAGLGQGTNHVVQGTTLIAGD